MQVYFVSLFVFAQLCIVSGKRRAICTAEELIGGILPCGFKVAERMVEQVDQALPEGCLNLEGMDALTSLLFGTGHTSHMISIDSSLRKGMIDEIEFLTEVLEKATFEGKVEWGHKALTYWREITHHIGDFLKHDMVDQMDLRRILNSSTDEIFHMKAMLGHVDVEYLMREMAKVHLYNGTILLVKDKAYNMFMGAMRSISKVDLILNMPPISMNDQIDRILSAHKGKKVRVKRVVADVDTGSMLLEHMANRSKLLSFVLKYPDMEISSNQFCSDISGYIDMGRQLPENQILSICQNLLKQRDILVNDTGLMAITYILEKAEKVAFAINMENPVEVRLREAFLSSLKSFKERLDVLEHYLVTDDEPITRSQHSTTESPTKWPESLLTPKQLEDLTNWLQRIYYTIKEPNVTTISQTENSTCQQEVINWQQDAYDRMLGIVKLATDTLKSRATKSEVVDHLQHQAHELFYKVSQPSLMALLIRAKQAMSHSPLNDELLNGNLNNHTFRHPSKSVQLSGVSEMLQTALDDLAILDAKLGISGQAWDDVVDHIRMKERFRWEKEEHMDNGEWVMSFSADEGKVKEYPVPNDTRHDEGTEEKGWDFIKEKEMNDFGYKGINKDDLKQGLNISNLDKIDPSDYIPLQPGIIPMHSMIDEQVLSKGKIMERDLLENDFNLRQTELMAYLTERAQAGYYLISNEVTPTFDMAVIDEHCYKMRQLLRTHSKVLNDPKFCRKLIQNAYIILSFQPSTLKLMTEVYRNDAERYCVNHHNIEEVVYLNNVEWFVHEVNSWLALLQKLRTNNSNHYITGCPSELTVRLPDIMKRHLWSDFLKLDDYMKMMHRSNMDWSLEPIQVLSDTLGTLERLLSIDEMPACSALSGLVTFGSRLRRTRRRLRSPSIDGLMTEYKRHSTSEKKYQCQYEPEVGPCKGAIKRWYFKPDAEICLEFVYGGCDGNDNNYMSEDDCYQECGNDSMRNGDPNYNIDFLEIFWSFLLDLSEIDERLTNTTYHWGDLLGQLVDSKYFTPRRIKRDLHIVVVPATDSVGSTDSAELTTGDALNTSEQGIDMTSRLENFTYGVFETTSGSLVNSKEDPFLRTFTNSKSITGVTTSGQLTVTENMKLDLMVSGSTADTEMSTNKNSLTDTDTEIPTKTIIAETTSKALDTTSVITDTTSLTTVTGSTIVTEIPTTKNMLTDSDETTPGITDTTTVEESTTNAPSTTDTEMPTTTLAETASKVTDTTSLIQSTTATGSTTTTELPTTKNAVTDADETTPGITDATTVEESTTNAPSTTDTEMPTTTTFAEMTPKVTATASLIQSTTATGLTTTTELPTTKKAVTDADETTPGITDTTTVEESTTNVPPTTDTEMPTTQNVLTDTDETTSVIADTTTVEQSTSSAVPTTDTEIPTTTLAETTSKVTDTTSLIQTTAATGLTTDTEMPTTESVLTDTDETTPGITDTTTVEESTTNAVSSTGSEIPTTESLSSYAEFSYSSRLEESTTSTISSASSDMLMTENLLTDRPTTEATVYVSDSTTMTHSTAIDNASTDIIMPTTENPVTDNTVTMPLEYSTTNADFSTDSTMPTGSSLTESTTKVDSSTDSTTVVGSTMSTATATVASDTTLLEESTTAVHSSTSYGISSTDSTMSITSTDASNLTTLEESTVTADSSSSYGISSTDISITSAMEAETEVSSTTVFGESTYEYTANTRNMMPSTTTSDFTTEDLSTPVDLKVEINRLMSYVIKRSMAIFYVIKLPENSSPFQFCTGNTEVFYMEANSTNSSALNTCLMMFEMRKDILSNKNLVKMTEAVVSLVASHYQVNTSNEDELEYKKLLLSYVRNVTEFTKELTETLRAEIMQFMQKNMPDYPPPLNNRWDAEEYDDELDNKEETDEGIDYNLRIYRKFLKTKLPTPSSHSPVEDLRVKRSAIGTEEKKLHQAIESVTKLVNGVKVFFNDLISRKRTRRQAETDEDDGWGLLDGILNVERCGFMPQWLSPKLLDAVISMDPMIIYYKNAFMLRWILNDQPITMLRSMIQMYLGEEWLKREHYVFGHVKNAIDSHCRMMSPMHPNSTCIKERIPTMHGCATNWPEVGPFIANYTSRYCDNFRPNLTIVKELRDNFATITNVVGCLMTDGKFDFMFESTEEMLTSPFGVSLLKAVIQCKLEEELMDIAEHLERFFKKFEPSVTDITAILNFLKRLSQRFTAPMRCVAKAFYPHCASKGVNLNSFLRSFLPQLKLMTSGMLDMSVERITFDKPKNFRSSLRRSVMMFGDPHILSLASAHSKDFQTCNEMELFKSGSVQSSEHILLMENEYYRIKGMLGRFSASSSGTFLSQVLVEFLMKGVDPLQRRKSKLTFDSNFTGLEPYMTMYHADGSKEAMVDKQDFMKYESGKMVTVDAKTKRDEKSMVRVKDQQTGTIIGITNPYGSVLNVVIRCAEDLLKISTGLLIDGCLDPDNRAEVIDTISVIEDEVMGNSWSGSRRKRQLSETCTQQCSGVEPSLTDTCVYDCFQASGTGLEEEVAGSMEDAEIITEEAVSEDFGMASEAEEEVVEEMKTEVMTTERFVTEGMFDDVVTSPASAESTQPGVNVSQLTSTTTQPTKSTTIKTTTTTSTAKPNTSTSKPTFTTTTTTTELTTKPTTKSTTTKPTIKSTTTKPTAKSTRTTASTTLPTTTAMPQLKPRKQGVRRGSSYVEALQMATDQFTPCSKNYISHMMMGICWDVVV